MHMLCLSFLSCSIQNKSTLNYLYAWLVGKNVHATIPKGKIRYDQYTVPDTYTVAAEITFADFL